VSSKKTLLIDADILVYRAGFAVQVNVDAEGNHPPTSHALQAMKMMLNNILNKYPGSPYRVFITSTDKSNFRYKLAKTKPYKGNRKQAKPIYFHDLREYLIDHWRAEVVYGQEADDALGIAADYDDTIIVTLDKDLDMVPGHHFNFVKGESYHISRTQAYRNFCYQLLVGDSVDNIVGCPGIGPVKASAALKKCGRDKQKMLQAAYNLYDNEELFLEQGNLLWIRRKEDDVWHPDLKTLREGKQALCTAGDPASKKE